MYIYIHSNQIYISIEWSWFLAGDGNKREEHKGETSATQPRHADALVQYLALPSQLSKHRGVGSNE